MRAAKSTHDACECEAISEATLHVSADAHLFNGGRRGSSNYIQQHNQQSPKVQVGDSTKATFYQGAAPGDGMLHACVGAAHF